MDWKDFANTSLPIGDPWFELRLGKYSRIYPSLFTMPIWPIRWQGWAMCAALIIFWGMTVSLFVARNYSPSDAAMDWIFGLSALTWLIGFCLKVRVIDFSQR